jgi:hypothetical protein
LAETDQRTFRAQPTYGHIPVRFAVYVWVNPRTRIARLLTVAFCSLICTFADEFPDVHLTLNLAKSPAIYHQGERIVAELSFSAPTAGKYAVSVAQNNIGEESRALLASERFFASPASGTEDPAVRRPNIGPFAGSILSGLYTLSENPLTVRLDLNEWLRFNKPGVYRIRAQSTRVAPFRSKATIAVLSHFTVTSNELKPTIVPADAAWIENQLNDIRSILFSPSASGEQKTIAALRLRYLDTEASTAEMARALPASEGQPYNWAIHQGLLEASWRTTAIRNLHEAIRNPRSRVSYETVQLLTALLLSNEYQNTPLPRYDAKHPKQSKAFQRATQQRRSRRAELWAKYIAELAASQPDRLGRPRTDALFLLWKDQEWNHSPQESLPNSLIALRRQILSVADDLTPGQQRELISAGWERLPKQELLPVVKRIALRPADRSSDDERLREMARSRWCEAEASACKDR